MILTGIAATIGFCIGGPIGCGALGALAASVDPLLVENGPQPSKPQTVTPPTRATSSQWVDPVDPEFQ